jgi:hypothetical protein
LEKKKEVAMNKSQGTQRGTAVTKKPPLPSPCPLQPGKRGKILK